MNKRTLLEVENLCKDYPGKGGFPFGQQAMIRVLNEVSLHLEEGETLGLVGESGSGKSTTGRAILRLLPATSGHVRFQGNEILDLVEVNFRQYRKLMQMIFQDPGGSLNPAYKIGASIEEPLIVHFPFMSKSERRDRVAELLRQVGLDPIVARRFPHEFSGGQRQRIGIARALAVGPKLIVADEAVSALDVSVQAQILNLFGELKENLGLSYLFIAHDLAVVKQMSQRVAVMYAGRIVETARSEDLYRHPAHPYTKLLIASVPRMAGTAPSMAPPALPEITGTGCAFAGRCPVAMKICAETKPMTREIGAGHSVACHQVP